MAPRSQLPDNDARQIARLAEYLDLDKDGYEWLVREAIHISLTEEFRHLVNLLAYALERLDELDQEQIRFLIGAGRLPALRHRTRNRGGPVQHLAFKAATQTTTDQGTFTALASTYSEDRGGDVVEPGAFGGTIARWKRAASSYRSTGTISPMTPPTSSAPSTRPRCKRHPMAWGRGQAGSGGLSQSQRSLEAGEGQLRSASRSGTSPSLRTVATARAC